MIGASLVGIIAYNIVKKSKDESRLSLVSKIEVECDNILDSAVYRTQTDRALIIKIHNGGSKMYVGVSKYASITQESHNDKLPSIKKDFQKFKVDKDDMGMIHTLISDGLVILETSRMPPSMLKRRHELDGVKSSIIYKIRETEFGFYYGSFSSTIEYNEFIGSHEYSILEAEINKLRNIYAEADRRGVLH